MIRPTTTKLELSEKQQALTCGGLLAIMELIKRVDGMQRARPPSAAPDWSSISNRSRNQHSRRTCSTRRREVRPTFPADVWQAFERTWLQDEAPADVAEQLQRPVTWVYKAKFRVLKRLREEVETLVDDLPVRPK